MGHVYSVALSVTMGPNTGPSGDIADTTAVASEQMSPPAAPSKQGVGTRNQSIIAINTSPPAPSMDNEAYSVLEVCAWGVGCVNSKS